MPEAKRRLAAILSADVAGYSRLMGDDERATMDTLYAYRDIFRKHISDHDGRVVDTAGDSVLAVFGSVVEAVHCAAKVQGELDKRNIDLPEGRQMLFRIGVNLGDVFEQDDGTIYGDGVNVAARLEALAEPGGVMISGSAHEQVEGKVDLAFRFAGEQTVKNITRPVRAYRLDGATAPQPGAKTPPPFAGKPSIAVLPLDNISGDAEQGYFADGITEDIITELSRFPDLFVIARNSTFTYKGRAVKIQQIGQELGARYVVEGSVRKAGNRVRVTVQLIEAEAGVHLWAERYDRELVDIFDIQDELTQAIVATLPGRVGAAEADRLRRRPPRDMAALDYLHAGRIHPHRVTKEDNAEAARLLDKAIELDPEFAQAYAWKACVLGQAIQFGFGGSPMALEEQAMALLGKAISLDENDVECHRLLCEVNMENKRLDRALIHGERAFSQNPNDPRLVAQKGELLTWLGKADEGVEWIEKSLRLDPHGAPGRAHLLGRALYGARRYAEAVEAFRQITAPRHGPLAEMAACHARLSHETEASELANAALAAKPDFTIESYVAMMPYQNTADRDHLAEGLQKAGLPT